jgi:YfiH family protein
MSGFPGGFPLLVPEWPVSPRVRAACTLRGRGLAVGPWPGRGQGHGQEQAHGQGREGTGGTGEAPFGVSRPPYDSLNLAVHVGDDPAAVAENRRRLREALGLPTEPVWLDQVHGAEVLRLGGSGPAGSAAPPGDDAPGGFADRPRADAAVTRERGLVAAIQVADCMPVLLAALDGSVIGAAHAGWRGVAAGVLEAAVRAMGAPAGEIVAWLGPAIGPRHFEVGEEVREALLAQSSAAGEGTASATASATAAGGSASATSTAGSPSASPSVTAAAFVRNRRGRWQCDLEALVRQRLTALGVRHIAGGGWCTFEDPERFFSFRRDGRCGRLAALIWLDRG